MRHSASRHYGGMVLVMILAGCLSTMNIWANSISDIRFSLNDAYMISLMTGWMLFFMSLWNGDLGICLGSGLLVIGSISAIRTQFLITESQFIRGMIPHHSMAVLMAKKLEEKPTTLQPLLTNIIESQEKEIAYMKTREHETAYA